MPAPKPQNPRDVSTGRFRAPAEKAQPDLIDVPPVPWPESNKILAIFMALFLMEEGRERQCLVEALLAFAWRAWGWNVERFHDEIAKAKMGLTNGKVTCWLSSGDNLKVDYREHER